MYQTEKILLWIVKGGLFLVPFIPLIVAYSLYFPFITGKNFAFRILIEILAVFWVWLMVRSPRFRPKLSPLTISYYVLIVILITATLLGLSPYHSFWSSYERMEGLLGHLHLFLYFLILSSVFIERKDWKIFFNASIVVSAIVTIYGLIQLAGLAAIHQGGERIDSFFGNAIYLAIYLLFHLFLIAIFFFQTKNWWLRALYAILFLMEALVFYYTGSRGPLLGLLAGMGLFIFILGLSGTVRIRRLALAALIIAFLIPVALYIFRDASVIRSNISDRFVTVADAAAEGRLLIWKIAISGWKERPILGWGQDNFLYVFAKNYNPALWKNEPWFDRAHNIFLDWLVSAGILGLGAYLVMLGASVRLLFVVWRAGRIDRYIFAGILSVLAAYLVQGFFVFDNLVSQIFFFALIAMIQSIFVGINAIPHKAPIRPKISPAGYTAIIISVILAVYSLVFFNIKPVLAAKSILNFLLIIHTKPPAGKVEAVIEEARRGIALNTFGTTEIRGRLQQTGSLIFGDQAIAGQDKQKYVIFLIEELGKQRRENPYDVRAMVFLANSYLIAGRYEDVLSLTNEALKISPRRQDFYFLAAETLISMNRNDEALQVLEKAYLLDPSYPDAVHNIAAFLIASGKVKEGEDFLEKHFGARTVPYIKFVGAYARIGDLKGVVAVWETLVAFSPNNAQYRVDLAQAYLEIGEKEKAIAQFKKAIELEPRFKERGEELIRKIQNVN